jgi:septum formation inhibitor-activating ATPase MinD
MSSTHESKKYINLEDVRVSYSPKDDNIHITSGDPDVQAGGFHLSLNRGTQTETTLRQLLEEAGVIKKIQGLASDSPAFVPWETQVKAMNDSLRHSPDRIVIGEVRDVSMEDSIPPAVDAGKVVRVTSSKGGTGKTSTAMLAAMAKDMLLKNPGSSLLVEDADTGLKTPLIDMNQQLLTADHHKLVLGGKIVAFSSLRSGAGGSSLTLAVGHMLSQKGFKVAVVDADLRDGHIGEFTGTSKPTVTNIVVDGPVTEESVSKNLIFDNKLKVSLLLAPHRPRNATYITPETYKSILTELQSSFDFVLVDTQNHGDQQVNDAIYSVATAIVGVALPIFGFHQDLARWKANLEPNVPEDKIGFVFNQVLPADGDYFEVITKIIEDSTVRDRILGLISSDSRTVNKALYTNDLAALLGDRSSLYAREMYKLADVLDKKLKP